MGPAAIPLLVAMVVLAGVNMATDISAAKKDAKAQIKQIERDMKAKAEKAQSKKSDRAAAADRTLASIRVAMAEQGGSGTDNERRFLDETAYLEGVDIARLEANRTREIDALMAEGKNVRRQFAAKRTAAMIGFASSVASAASGMPASTATIPTTAATDVDPRTGRLFNPV